MPQGWMFLCSQFPIAVLWALKQTSPSSAVFRCKTHRFFKIYSSFGRSTKTQGLFSDKDSNSSLIAFSQISLSSECNTTVRIFVSKRSSRVHVFSTDRRPSFVRSTFAFPCCCKLPFYLFFFTSSGNIRWSKIFYFVATFFSVHRIRN